MKRLSILLLVVMVSLSSCAINQEKEIAEESNIVAKIFKMKLGNSSFRDRFNILLEKRPSGLAEPGYKMLWEITIPGFLK